MGSNLIQLISLFKGRNLDTDAQGECDVTVGAEIGVMGLKVSNAKD